MDVQMVDHTLDASNQELYLCRKRPYMTTDGFPTPIGADIVHWMLWS
jgi:hypothetical protein